MLQSDKILVGSSYFFNSFEDFKSKDMDYVIIVDNPRLFEYYLQKRFCRDDLFYWNRGTIMSYNYDRNPMSVGKFLVPEILSELNLTFDDVRPLLEEYLPKGKDRHQYQIKIFEYYKLNNSTFLTEEQRVEVYEIYKNEKQTKNFLGKNEE